MDDAATTSVLGTCYGAAGACEFKGPRPWHATCETPPDALQAGVSGRCESGSPMGTPFGYVTCGGVQYALVPMTPQQYSNGQSGQPQLPLLHPPQYGPLGGSSTLSYDGWSSAPPQPWVHGASAVQHFSPDHFSGMVCDGRWVCDPQSTSPQAMLPMQQAVGCW